MSEHFQEYKKSEHKEFNHEEDFEILWSREKNYSGNYFMNDDSFSDFTERSSSSCSWHNDEFDMKSSNKVTKSLEAIEDALYDKQLSSFISKEVYQECNHWTDRFLFLRLKGKKIELTEDNADQDSSQKETLHSFDENTTLSFCVEGKRLPLHFAEKPCKKSTLEELSESYQTPTPMEDIDDVDKCCYDSLKDILGCKTEGEKTLELESETSNFINDIQEKVVEKLAQNIWPKVIELLFENRIAHELGTVDAEFQLPPIVAAQVEYKTYLPTQRPKTEDNSSQIIDFPDLSTFLSVSPKILQDRKDCRSSKSRSSRPNSEIQLSRRSTVPKSFQNKKNSHNMSEVLRLSNTSKRVYFTSEQKNRTDEKNADKIPLCLPALEEDITSPVDFLKDFASSSKTNRSTPITSCLPSKPEGFLPPIYNNNNLAAKVKLTRDLFTFLESDIQYSREVKPKSFSSRPNTCASKREHLTSGNLRYKFSENNFLSRTGKHYSELDKYRSHTENQVTLFPIVTSLVPSREKNFNTRKDLQNSTSTERKR